MPDAAAGQTTCPVTVTVTVGGKTSPAVRVNVAAGVTFSGRVAPGLCQIKFTVPGGLTGTNPLTMSTSTVSYTLWIAP
jgi:hypothetical protein